MAARSVLAVRAAAGGPVGRQGRILGGREASPRGLPLALTVQLRRGKPTQREARTEFRDAVAGGVAVAAEAVVLAAAVLEVAVLVVAVLVVVDLAVVLA